ncbi:unnamed protein product [Linum trigynum]|uniref:Uncharacterized protein n=1 Tax=Linum trigynum TaxID=586398 RepID=A0AAV2CRY8_9ROSI
MKTYNEFDNVNGGEIRAENRDAEIEAASEEAFGLSSAFVSSSSMGEDDNGGEEALLRLGLPKRQRRRDGDCRLHEES